MRILIIVGLLTLFLSSCATTYSCKTQTAGKCQSISEVYANVNKEDHSNDNNSNIDSNKMENSGAQILAQPLEGKAVLKEPKVIRVLLNYFEDEERDLNLGGYIFVKVEDAKWAIQ